MGTRRLTPEQIQALHERARREAGPFTDPHVMGSPVHGGQWATAILGRPYNGPRSVTWEERYLLHIAMQAEPNPPAPQPSPAVAAERAELEAAARRREERIARERREWEELAARLPVRVEVRHNYTSHRHLGHFTQGGDHIFLLEELRVGRLHRQAGRVMCWTPSRAKDLREFPEPAGDNRTPSCKACLRTARRVAGLTAEATG